MALGAVVARILTQYSDKGSKAAQKDINKLGKQFDAFAKKTVRAFGIAAAASAAFAVKIGKDAVQAAIADQKSQALLANSLRNTVGASDDQIASVEKNITALQKQFKVVDDELRPAFGRLAAAFGSTTAASFGMQMALDVSASAGVDLATASDAIIKASQGQFRAITKLVPGIGAATLATKDFGEITDKVSKLTAGAAAARAETLEYKLLGLKIAYGEVLETLGYALLPVMEKFANLVSTKLLPQLESFIAVNKDKLASSFQVAADAAFKFLTLLVAIGDWIANNTGLVKKLAIAFGAIFVTSKIYSMITALNLLTAAIGRVNIAMGAGAIGAITKTTAKAGALGTLGVALAGGSFFNSLGYKIAGAIPGTSANSLKKIQGNLGKKGISPRGNSNNVDFSDRSGISTVDNALNGFTAGLTKSTKALKTASSMQDKINAEAARQNLARQAKLSGSTTIAIGGGSKLYQPNSGANVVVNVGGSVTTEQDLVTSIVNGIERTTRRSFGTVGAFDK